MEHKLYKALILLMVILIAVGGVASSYVTIDIYPISTRDEQHEQYVKNLERMITMIKTEEDLKQDDLINYLEADLQLSNDENAMYKHIVKINQATIELISICVLFIIVFALLIYRGESKNT